MASNHNNLDVNNGASLAPAQDPLVATPLQQQHDAIQSVPKIEVEDAAQDLLHYTSTDNIDEISRDLCPELTEEFSQLIKQNQANPPARTKNQFRYKIRQIRCNLSASYLEYRHRRICSMKARAAAAAANSWPPGIVARIRAALKFLCNLRFLPIEWCLANIDPLGPLAPLIFSLVYAIVGYWFLYSDPFEGQLIKIGISILSTVWTIDYWLVVKAGLWEGRPQAHRDNTLEYFHQLNYERALILGAHRIS